MAKRGLPATLKLYAWEHVLTDWTDGAMFALAHDSEHARRHWLRVRVILEKSPAAVYDLGQPPRVIEKPEGFAVWGGG